MLGLPLREESSDSYRKRVRWKIVDCFPQKKSGQAVPHNDEAVVHFLLL